MRTQVSDRSLHLRSFPIDPVATIVLRLGQMRLALDPTLILKLGKKTVIRQVHDQLNALKRLMADYSDAPLMAVLLAILERIDKALENASLDFAQQAISNLEDTLRGAC